MTRPLPLLAAAALLAWLVRSSLRRTASRIDATSSPAPQADEDGVQPADPVTVERCLRCGMVERDYRHRCGPAQGGKTCGTDICHDFDPVWQVTLTQAEWGEMQHVNSHEHRCDACACPQCPQPVHDPTYIEAREVAIRRGGQSSEYSTEGM